MFSKISSNNVLAKFFHSLSDPFNVFLAKAAKKVATLIEPIRKTDAGFMMHILEQDDIYYCQKLKENEEHLFKWVAYINAGDVVFDIGGYRGIASLIVAYHTKGGAKIFAFETNPFNVRELFKNVLLNDYRKCIFPLNIGIGDRFLLAKFGFGKDLPDYAGCGLVIPGEDRGTEKRTLKYPVFVPIMKIDDLVLSRYLPQPDHIKIDVDGAERLVLRGASQTLTKVKSIALEWVDTDQEVLSIINELEKQGFNKVFERVNSQDAAVGSIEGGNNIDTVFLRG